jgi:hypothetical protein
MTEAGAYTTVDSMYFWSKAFSEGSDALAQESHVRYSKQHTGALAGEHQGVCITA